jgi:hypothetical protein
VQHQHLQAQQRDLQSYCQRLEHENRRLVQRTALPGNAAPSFLEGISVRVVRVAPNTGSLYHLTCPAGGHGTPRQERHHCPKFKLKFWTENMAQGAGSLWGCTGGCRAALVESPVVLGIPKQRGCKAQLLSYTQLLHAAMMRTKQPVGWRLELLLQSGFHYAYQN